MRAGPARPSQDTTFSTGTDHSQGARVPASRWGSLFFKRDLWWARCHPPPPAHRKAAAWPWPLPSPPHSQQQWRSSGGRVSLAGAALGLRNEQNNALLSLGMPGGANSKISLHAWCGEGGREEVRSGGEGARGERNLGHNSLGFTWIKQAETGRYCLRRPQPSSGPESSGGRRPRDAVRLS